MPVSFFGIRLGNQKVFGNVVSTDFGRIVLMFSNATGLARTNTSLSWKRSSMLLLMACCLSVFVVTSSVVGETFSVYGTPFQVDSLASVDSSSIKISIRGESRIVPKSERELFIVRTSLADPRFAAEFSNSALADLTENALKAGDERVATVSYLALTRRPEASDSLYEGLVINLARQPAFHGFAKGVLENLDPSAGVAGVFRLLVESPVAVIETISRSRGLFFEQQANEVQELLYKHYLSLLSGRAYDAAEKVWITANTLYSDSSRLDRFRQERGVVSAILLASRNLDLPRLMEIRHSPVLQASDVLGGVLTDGLHSIARQSLNKGRYREVLQIIANVDVNQVTPATHEIAGEALTKGVADGIGIAEILGDLPIALMLRSLASGNAALSLNYLRALEDYASSTSPYSASDLALAEIVRLRPDPSEANDTLRYRLATQRAWSGDREGARQLLESVSAPPSFAQRGKLFLLGLYVPVYVLYPGAALVLFAAILGFLKRRAARLLGEKAEARRVMERTGGFRGVVDPNSELRLEYLGLLREFGLGQDSTIKEIKAVYRTQVKAHHPDSAGAGRVSDEFLVMNDRYQRLLALHQKLGKSDGISE